MNFFEKMITLLGHQWKLEQFVKYIASFATKEKTFSHAHCKTLNRTPREAKGQPVYENSTDKQSKILPWVK